MKKDLERLFNIALDLWTWEQHQNKDCYALNQFKVFVEEALASNGTFTIIDAKEDNVIGISRFRIIDEKKIIEIGWSFLGREY